ncbi:Hsp70 family protein [Pseudobacteriovorax antillogorgiicola]|uniref:Hypothetical chaperone protein n=1 Tax=Pseudobacteriovorax antillogorgiicola TaxID=1513793 RepID=A0A1Y6BCW2_9BACT|nr:Hsp70 family protein [Pseudobacteriovorax antillogorgiicola]TCS57271.1 putative chaperone protein [Pseudobacteriovorax antillogorgiicola]SMF03215.1 hypothetical chaperone protein [Pseudobacteriovorax antillogorgiicola]
MTKPTFYAIDYGTSNSLLCGASQDGIFTDVVLDKSAPDPTILKSILFSTDSDHWVFGAEAIEQYIDQPGSGRVFKSLKRFLPDPTFKGTRVFSEFLSVPDLIAKQLRCMRERANDYFDADVRSVVMGCPAVFSQDAESNQCAFDRLEVASRAAGFDHIEFCPEPIAAAYKFRHQLDSEKIVAVADFGGGTSDFTILKMGRKEFKPDDVLALGGLSIAGDKYDGAIMKDIISPHFGSLITYRRPMSKNNMSFPKGLIRKLCSPADMLMLNRGDVLDYLRDAQRYITKDEDAYKIDQLLTLIEERQGFSLFKKIEESKIELSDQRESQFSYQYPMIDVEETIRQQDFYSASSQFTEDILACLDKTLNQAGLSSNDIDIVCLTGGTANIPTIKQGLVNRFQDRLALSEQFHSVVHGLADRAQMLAREA